MNPQPSEHVGNIGALLFFALFIFYAIKAYLDGQTVDIGKIDLITFGYLEDPVNTKTQVANTNFESQQLYLDCIEALYTLGYKKLEAKKKAKLIFSTFNPQPASIQEFLSVALKK